MGKRKFFVLSIVLFLIIFNPPFYKGLSFTMISVGVMFLMCAIYSKQLFEILYRYNLKKFIAIMLLFTIWYTLSSVINALFSEKGAQCITNLLSTCIYLLSAIIVAFGLTVFAKKHEYTLDMIMDLFIAVATLQALISVVCLAIPEFKQFLNNWTINNSNSEALVRALIRNSYRRNYGFASTLYDIFGCTMSIIAMFAFAKGIYQKWRYLLCYALISLSAIVNARTSIVLIAVGTIVILLTTKGRKIEKQELIKKVLLVFAGGIIIILALGWISTSESDTSKWLMEGVGEIVSMMKGKKTGYFSILFDEFIFFPDLIECIVGTGLTPLQAINVGTDVGYVQNIWQYGIVGSIVLYIAYTKLFMMAEQNVKSKYPGLIFALFIMVAIYMIKLNCIGYTMASTVFMPFLMACVVLEKDSIREEQGNERYLLTK